jgi:hypothetical protein
MSLEKSLALGVITVICRWELAITSCAVGWVRSYFWQTERAIALPKILLERGDLMNRQDTMSWNHFRHMHAKNLFRHQCL